MIHADIRPAGAQLTGTQLAENLAEPRDVFFAAGLLMRFHDLIHSIPH
jgi:hypothetical protein